MKKFEELKKDVGECSCLSELFALWEKAHKAEDSYTETTVDGIDKNFFIKDGYIDRDCYNKSEYKVLFILKEANILNYPKRDSQVGFYTNYIINNEDLNNPKQQEKMGRMAYYLMNGGGENAKTPSEIRLKDALNASAFLNINKRGGAKKTIPHILNAYYNRYEQFLKREIEIINPDCIVMVGATGADRSIRNFAAEKNIRIIPMWHTAYQIPKQERNDNPIYALPGKNGAPDKNVDLYMRKFFERASENK